MSWPARASEGAPWHLRGPMGPKRPGAQEGLSRSPCGLSSTQEGRVYVCAKIVSRSFCADTASLSLAITSHNLS
eukprot:1776127-Pyramimonas_sp.AAC.1